MLRLWCVALLITVVVSLELKAQLKDHWKTFKSTHSKIYSADEEDKRKDIFRKNVENVLQHNLKHDLGEVAFRIGINGFSDMTKEELREKYLGLAPESTLTSSLEDVEDDEDIEDRAGEEYPDFKDWRDSGYVNPPKNQNPCGSCWAFAAVGALETRYGLAKKQQVVLSEQNLLDCAENKGCKGGGNVPNAYNYIVRNGIDLQQCYPYKAEKSDTCQFNKTCVGATMRGFKRIMYDDEDDLLRVVATKGPVAVSIHVADIMFDYTGQDIFDYDDCDKTVNHGVVVVGYGTDNGKQYWLIRNSWGGDWGLKGYLKLARNAGNMCRVASSGFYPLV